jgi:hypothetical protein
MADEQGAKSFWQTIPGLFTGLATVLTAITGLVIALNPVGYFQKSSSERPSSTATTAQAVARATPNGIVREPIANRTGAGHAQDDALSGVWLNNMLSAKNGQPESRLVITRLPGGNRIIQGWGNCEHKQCDWGAAPLTIVAGDSRNDLNGLRATTKLVNVMPSKNREDVSFLTLIGTSSANTLTVRRRYEAYVNAQLTTQIERLAVYTRAQQ